MAGWHHWLDGRESEWTLGVGDGQGGLECCDSWGHKESDTTEWLNWTELNWTEDTLTRSSCFAGLSQCWMPAIIFIFGDPIQNTYSFKINHGNSDSLHWMVVYLWSPKKKISLRDQRCGFSHSELCVARVLLKWKGIEKDSDRDIGRGQKECPSLFLARHLCTFSIGISQGCKGLIRPIPTTNILR